MRLWCVMIAAGGLLVATAADTSSLKPAEVGAAQKIYTSKCARCHKFYEPTGYDDHEWTVWMGKMRKKARLNAAVMLSRAAIVRHDLADEVGRRCRLGKRGV